MAETRVLMQKPKNLRFLTYITTLITIISSIIYVTWFIAMIDKRVVVTETQQIESQEKMDVLRNEMNTLNNYRDAQQTQFRNEVYEQLNQVNDRVEKIYGILLDFQKRQAL